MFQMEITRMGSIKHSVNGYHVYAALSWRRAPAEKVCTQPRLMLQAVVHHLQTGVCGGEQHLGN